jgi:hypothetical protein
MAAFKKSCMKNSKKSISDGNPQTALPTKKKNKTTNNHEPPVANRYTNMVKNTAHETRTLNQTKTTKNDLEPGF